MAYPYNPFMDENNPFTTEQPEQQQQQQQGMPLGGLTNLMGGAGGASSAAGFEAAGAGIQGIGGIGAGGGSAAAAGGAGGGSAGGFGSAAAAGGPWAALAAIVIGNELMASKKGHRRGKAFSKKHIKDIASTEVLNQDIEGRILPKLGIKEDTKLSKGISLALNPLSLDFGKTWDRIKDIF